MAHFTFPFSISPLLLLLPFLLRHANLFSSFSRDVVASHSQMQMKRWRTSSSDCVEEGVVGTLGAKAQKDWITRALHSERSVRNKQPLCLALGRRLEKRSSSVCPCLCFVVSRTKYNNTHPLALRGYPPKKENKNKTSHFPNTSFYKDNCKPCGSEAAIDAGPSLRDSSELVG